MVTFSNMVIQVLQKIRGTMEVDEEFNDICEACVEANKVMTVECVPPVTWHYASACVLLWCLRLQFCDLVCCVAARHRLHSVDVTVLAPSMMYLL